MENKTTYRVLFLVMTILYSLITKPKLSRLSNIISFWGSYQMIDADDRHVAICKF